MSGPLLDADGRPNSVVELWNVGTEQFVADPPDDDVVRVDLVDVGSSRPLVDESRPGLAVSHRVGPLPDLPAGGGVALPAVWTTRPDALPRGLEGVAAQAVLLSLDLRTDRVALRT